MDPATRIVRPDENARAWCASLTACCVNSAERSDEPAAAECAGGGAPGIGGDDVRTGLQVIPVDLQEHVGCVRSTRADQSGRPVSTPRRCSSVPIAPSRIRPAVVQQGVRVDVPGHSRALRRISLVRFRIGCVLR